MMKRYILLTGVLSILLLVPPAFALPIDLTSSEWENADGLASYSVDYGAFEVTATATPEGRGLSYNPDGMGIGDDELSDSWFGPREMITLSFSESVWVSSFTVADLFADEGWWGADEEGGFSYSPGGSPTVFSLDDGDYNPDGGYLTYAFESPVWVDTFTFYGIESLAGWKDFSVASIETTDVAPVPEPATMLLLGTGLIGMAGFGRKRLKK